MKYLSDGGNVVERAIEAALLESDHASCSKQDFVFTYAKHLAAAMTAETSRARGTAHEKLSVAGPTQWSACCFELLASPKTFVLHRLDFAFQGSMVQCQTT